MKRRRVVVAQSLVRLHRELQPKVELADLARVPHDRVAETAVRREADFPGSQLLRALHEAHLGGDVARQVALHRVRDGDLFAEQPVRRCGDLLHRKVGDRFVPPGDNAVNRDSLVAVARGDADGGGAKVPVAVAQQQDGLEIFLLPEHRAKRAAQVGADLPRLAKRVRHGQIRRRGECPDQHLGAGLERLPERALVLRINPGSPGDDVVRADDVARLHASRSVAKNRDLRRFGALNAPDKLRSQQRERQHRHRHESNDLEKGDFAATAIALPVAPAQPCGQRHHADPGEDDHHRGCKRPVTHAAAGWGLGGTASAIEPGRMSHASTTSASSIRNRNRRQISPCNAVSSRCAWNS